MREGIYFAAPPGKQNNSDRVFVTPGQGEKKKVALFFLLYFYEVENKRSSILPLNYSFRVEREKNQG